MSACATWFRPTHNLFSSFPLFWFWRKAWRSSQVSDGLGLHSKFDFLWDYIHGQAPTAKKFTHHNIRRRSKRKIPPQSPTSSETSKF
jgi:hypothetical protein